MNFDEACKMAYEYYKNGWKIEGLSEVKDLGEKWLFYPNTNEPVFGSSYITINKNNGKLEQFILPDEENFKLLKEAINIDIPENYK